MKIQRTFWIQEHAQLIYAGSTREEVVPGTPSFMTLPLPLITRAPKTHAQLIGSLTKSGLHAPVIDIDFPATLVRMGKSFSFKAIHPSKLHYNSMLQRRLAACGFAKNAKVKPSEDMVIELIFDVPVVLVPSKTQGHFHLYINHETTWRKYRNLLMAMYKASLVHGSFCEMCFSARMSFVRKPNAPQAKIRQKTLTTF